MAEDEVLTEDGAEETRAPNDAVILSYSQTPVNYNAVPKVWLTHPDSTEEASVLVPFTYGEAVSKTVEPDFSNGDMAVEVPEGELVTELTVKKPEELTPENIPEGMYIAGVGPGAFKGGSEEVEKTVELDFSAGDMEVTPETGKVFSKVTIQKPETLVPENIAEGVNIANVIGTLVTGGGGGDISITTTTHLGTSTTITHGHGVVPDLLLIFPKAGNQYTFVGSNYKSKFMGLVYVSPELAAKLGLSSWCIKEIYTNYQGILVYKPYESYTVTEETVALVNTPPNAVSFEVLAISGLT